ncbi:hypothetical protein Bca52824_007908 [Brassica carinata]|uniref:Uncharacterized protein n=1 Tax=Brassica carinata TaxID=52824 RepID=A0A8X8B7I3_BRACI|nr:hypothetical protein Bca52824_007908 [Brassica carinata]
MSRLPGDMMKASLGRLRRFALPTKVDAIDGLARASKDMQEMRESYDRLLSVAAATANSAYEFSESLGRWVHAWSKSLLITMKKVVSRILLKLGQVQFELQKLVDTYRSQIFKTITRPSESLLSDLRTVEDMKQQCEEKRDVVKNMVMEHVKDKVRLKGSKGERLIRPKLETARDELQDEATLCIFRLKSLKEGQARSLLTQAAPPHFSGILGYYKQLICSTSKHLFLAGLKSLEAVEQQVRIARERQHIDCELSDNANGIDGELSFDYITTEQSRSSTYTTWIDEVHKDVESNLYSRLPRPSETTQHAFSGPVKPSSTRLPFPAQAHSSSPRMSPAASPPLASSPRINELHELPRPPGQSAPPRRSKSPVLTSHSSPVSAWSQERSNVAVSKNIVASPLPVPPLVVPRSYSIPSINQRTTLS